MRLTKVCARSAGTQIREIKKKMRQIEKKNASYKSLCPLNVDTQSPVFVFQSFTLLSSLPLAKIVESGLQATELTLRLR
jgi:hypothetical protein